MLPGQKIVAGTGGSSSVRLQLKPCLPTLLIAGIADDIAEVGVGCLAIGLIDADPLPACQRPQLWIQQACQDATK